MNMKTKILTLALMAGLGISLPVFSANSTDIVRAMAGATALELPAKAADLVAKATARDKENVANAVIKAAMGVNPSAAIAIVGAVVQSSPGTAPVVAVTAATLQHKRLEQIVKAAVHAAPSEAGKVVAALIKEFPQDYGTIAIAASEGAPTSGVEILAAVADYVPALQSAIKGSTNSYAANNGNVPVQAILMQSYNQALTSGAVVSTRVPTALAVAPVPSPAQPTVVVSAPSGPYQGPPYVPILGPVVNYGPGQVNPQSPGGRNYSSP